jgi:aromatic-L-amino-acid/L-tryptophan decarboxylase
VLLRPELSVVVLRCTLPDGGATAEVEDALTGQVLAAVNAERRVFLSSIRLDGRYVGRLCMLNHRLQRAHVLRAVETIRRSAADAARRHVAAR